METDLEEAQAAANAIGWSASDTDNTVAAYPELGWPCGLYRNSGSGTMYFNDSPSCTYAETGTTYETVLIKYTVTPAVTEEVPAVMGEKSFEVCDSFAAMREAALAAAATAAATQWLSHLPCVGVRA